MTTSIRSQLTFSGEATCDAFNPHHLKPNKCVECFSDITKHKSNAVLDDEHIRRAMESTQSGEKLPSCIIDGALNLGALYLGGFKAILNKKFMKEANITHVVNTARGLEMFGPKYTNGVEAVKSSGVEFRELNWVDSTEFTLPVSDCILSCNFIHRALTSGGNVIVHCAQGKSRSTSVVICYLLAREPDRFKSVLEALSFVQSRRRTAEPNRAFMDQLQKHFKDGVFDELFERL